MTKNTKVKAISKRTSSEEVNSCGCSHCDANIISLEQKVSATDHHEKDHTHDHSGAEGLPVGKSVLLLASFILLIIASFSQVDKNISLLLYITAYLLSGYSVVMKALKGLINREWLDENFLMLIASIAAFLIGEYPEGVAVIIFYGVGGLFEDMAIHRSRKSIQSLMAIKPEFARIQKNGEWVVVDPNLVEVGKVIMVKAGERLPLDGYVVEGHSSLDTSAITGESLYQEVLDGSEVFAGAINIDGVLKIMVTKPFNESTVSRILELVEQAADQKADTEKFITRFAKVYTPAVVGAATLLALLPPIFGFGDFVEWFYRAAIFLVVSCPCGLVISVPLGYFGGIGNASRHGILIKGGNYLEVLKSVTTVVLDKTGTLTKGQFEVSHTDIIAEGWDQDRLIKTAAHLEHFSHHPIAASIERAYRGRVIEGQVKDIIEHKGKGMTARFEGEFTVVGNAVLLDELGIHIPEVAITSTLVYVALNDAVVGVIHLEDALKSEAVESIGKLRALGVNEIIMLTGDTNKTAAEIASKAGITSYFAQLLPHQKVEQLELILAQSKKNEKVIFVGDGINDAPVLARADAGVAMGGVGSDAAIEAADIVIMSDHLSALPRAIEIARYTNLIVWQNILFSFGVKGLILLMAVFGLANMWLAVFADVGVAIIAILNAVRVLKH